MYSFLTSPPLLPSPPTLFPPLLPSPPTLFPPLLPSPPPLPPLLPSPPPLPPSPHQTQPLLATLSSLRQERGKTPRPLDLQLLSSEMEQYVSE